MAQFIQYLYEYENGKRVRNLGFMKVEKQMDKSIIQIYSKQVDEVKGIIFQKEDGKQYYATWEPETEGMNQKELNAGSPKEESDGREMAETALQPKESEMKKPEMKKPEMKEPEIKEPEIKEPESETIKDPESEEIDRYQPQASRRVKKIQRQDLSRLPRREWRLANNSFLLHGYHNYHHLLYMEDGEKVWVGVPGIFHEKEQMAANAFGFGKFQRLTDFEMELSEEEKNTYEDFGYWCRQVARS